jgi:flavin reductase (DIM6/NTAB) family NADH-FMN oxidoreductase RutF
MKYELNSRFTNFTESWGRQFKIFSWVEYVSAIPQTISAITTWKANRIPNACLQAWTMYSGDADGYYVILSIMNDTHTSKNMLTERDFVVNFPGMDEFPRCYQTIRNNADEIDEITASGLTVEPSQVVNAPRIKECFLNLECRLDWHRPSHDGSYWHLFAGEVIHVGIEGKCAQGGTYGRYGSCGFIYNIHSPIDPATGVQDDAMVGTLEPARKME